MKQVRRAIHIRTGQRADVDAVEEWLAAHHVDLLPCSDAYDACVRMATDAHDAPELALLGIDWLAPDDLAVVTYLRRTWPHIAVVVYGGDSASAAQFELDPATRTCRVQGTLMRLLRLAPDELLARFAMSPASVGQPRRVPVTPAAPPTPTRPVTTASAPPLETAARRSAPEAITPRATLSREELAALLDGLDDE